MAAMEASRLQEEMNMRNRGMYNMPYQPPPSQSQQYMMQPPQWAPPRNADWPNDYDNHGEIRTIFRFALSARRARVAPSFIVACYAITSMLDV